MADLQLVQWLRARSENDAVALARSLIFAEASVLGVKVDDVSMSGRVKAADGGIDGRTNFPTGDSLLPTGQQVWQVKSGATAPSATTEIDHVKHPNLIAAVRGGADYVLFWTNDPVDNTAKTVKANFEAAIRNIRADAKVTFLFAEAIELLCLSHIAVIMQGSPYPLNGVVSLDVWGAKDDFSKVEYQSDASRGAMIDQIRTHASGLGPGQSTIHVIGDTGLGKSRLVHRALSMDGIRQRVLVAPDADSFDRSLLTTVAQRATGRLVLVVDDCDADQRKALSSICDMAVGRIRLVTIGPRASRHAGSQDSRYLELLPLQVDACQLVAASQGIGEADSRMVAEFTDGYPGLALSLAKAIANETAQQSLIQRVRQHEDLGLVLSSLLPGAAVRPMGMLALFEKLGFEDDLAPEFDLACSVFDIDPVELRSIIERELGRFVSSAGRFRRVTPKLFAVWLASQFLGSSDGSLATALEQLTDTLKERIYDQMVAYAGDPTVARTLEGVLGQSPFLEGAIADVNGGAGRLLHVGAITAPRAAMDAITRIMAGATLAQLKAAESGRREIVWTLDLLSRFGELFDEACDALLRLALAENETWGNNSSGVLKGLFRVFLGGTSVSYEHRMAWIERHLNGADDSTSALLLDCLSMAFEAHEVGMVANFGGLAPPSEWHPSSVEEEVSARGHAWAILIREAGLSDRRREVAARVIAAGLRTAIGRGDGPTVLRDIASVRWLPGERAEIGNALSNFLQYDEPAPVLGRLANTLLTSLRGGDLEERVQYVISLGPWDLADSVEEATNGTPSIVLTLVADLLAAGYEDILRAASATVTGQPQTAGVLFGEIARQGQLPELLFDLVKIEPVPTAAVLGAVRPMEEQQGADWIDAVIAEWSAETRLASLVLPAIHQLPATVARVELALNHVEAGLADPRELGQFAYWAWSGTVPADSAIRLSMRLAEEGSAYSVEHAMGILNHWIDRNPEGASDDAVAGAVWALLIRSVGFDTRTSSMLALYRSNLLHSVELSVDQRLELVIGEMRSLESFIDEYTVAELGRLAETAPEETTRLVLEMLIDLVSGGFNPAEMWLQNANVLSVLLGTVPIETLLHLIDELVPAERLPNLIDHLNIGTPVPDPVLVHLLETSNSEELRAKAYFRFLYPQSGWWGSEADFLSERREVALGWQRDSNSAELLSWLAEVLTGIRARIDEVRIREAERGC